MIVVMEKNYTSDDINQVVNYITNKNLGVNVSKGKHNCVIGILGNISESDLERVKNLKCVSKILKVEEPYKKANRLFHPEDTIININDNKIGNKHLGIIAGPCAVESEEQIVDIGRKVKKSGANFLRGGAFKPRTSPYSFQGLELDGLKLMEIAKKETGLPIISELMSISYLDEFMDIVDVIQIGARNMQNYDLLKQVGKTNKPIILKRGLSSTIEEWLLSAEHIMAGGNENIILCERGIRTFETYTRNTLDLSAIPVVKKHSHLPIIVDPSHGTGSSEYVESMSKAAVVAGCDGLMIEVHNNPQKALSDGQQSITPDQFDKLMKKIKILSSIED
ncbi:3-deoxy-7-phosphoheptulonate synthase [Terrisporobacter glycolicus]|uniref:Phospho-2-dehydro-3-deoxyheptonate aldolase n=1 Tax=Terrisporobacter petrolearius TaxID=1460447 RepID=A0ABZ3FKY1_9FIRM|nr:3-deoxy-7-phosphoheptulonate synthase [Terrisporobacter glycolicus]